MKLNTKHSTFLLFRGAMLSLLSLLVLFSGCTKEDSGVSSGSISFSAPTSYINGTETKTSYSGILSGGREGINWVNGDLVRIYSPEAATLTNEHSSDYVVTLKSSSSSSTSKSTATIDPKEGRGNGLWWGSSSTHKFYAVYPSPATSGMSGNVSITGNVINFTIPGTQTYTASGNTLTPDMNYAYMWAAVQTNVSSNVNLSFNPMFTAFEFTIDSGDKTSMTLKSFTLSSASTAMSGSCQATVTASTNSSASSINYTSFPTAITANRQITVSFGSGITVTKTSPVKVTVFALPRNYSDLTAKWTTGSGQEHSLPLKKNGSYVTFSAGRKYKIYNMSLPEDWTYDISGTGLQSGANAGGGTYTFFSSLTSTKTRGTITESVPVKLQYRSSTSDAWTDGPPPGVTIKASKAGTFSGSNTKTLSLEGEDITVTFPSASLTDTVETRDNTYRRSLSSRTAVSNYDLSLFDVAGNSISRTTANCYIVTAPGTYRFPMVYGNAIKNGSTNAAAYTRQQTTNTASAYPERFVDHLGNPLGQSGSGYSNSVYINQRYSSSTPTAQLLWEDSEGLVSNVAVNGNYITFSVPAATINEGNALIGVFINGKIAWSWHIWVTTGYSYATYRYNDGGTLNGSTSWGSNELGFVNGDKIIEWPEVKWYVRLVQVENGVERNDRQMVVKRYKFRFRNFHALYYQWGRHCPSASYNHVFKTTFYPVGGAYLPQGAAMSSGVEDLVNQNTWSIRESIQYPYVANAGTSEESWLGGAANLWNTAWDGDYNALSRTTPIKTIYDPSPVGFRVPSLYVDNLSLEEWRYFSNSEYYIGPVYCWHTNGGGNNWHTLSSEQASSSAYPLVRRHFHSGSLRGSNTYLYWTILGIESGSGVIWARNVGSKLGATPIRPVKE